MISVVVQYLIISFVSVVILYCLLYCTGTYPPWLFGSACDGTCDVNVRGVRSGGKTYDTRSELSN